MAVSAVSLDDKPIAVKYRESDEFISKAHTDKQEDPDSSSYVDVDMTISEIYTVVS